MVTAINTQALANSVSGSKSSTKTEKPDSEQIFKELDTGGKGYLTVDDLQAAVVKISAEGAQRADVAAQAAPNAPSAQDLLARLDGDGNGQVTQQEFKAGEPKAPPAAASSGGGARAAAPAGGQAPAGGAEAGGAVSSSSQIHDPADTDEDGKVSAREQQAYEVKLADEKAAAQEANGPRAAEADAAVKAYAAVEQLGAAG